MENIDIEIEVKKPKIKLTDDPEYYKKYYHIRLGDKINCDICNKIITRQKLNRHKKSSRCKVITIL